MLLTHVSAAVACAHHLTHTPPPAPRPACALCLLHSCCLSNGATQWILRNASAVKIPGAQYSYEDVGIIPDKMDIKAGNAVVHIIDLP